MEDKKDIEVVSGDGTNLNISPVFDHLEAGKPNTNKPTNIVVPEEKAFKKNKKDKKK